MTREVAVCWGDVLNLRHAAVSSTVSSKTPSATAADGSGGTVCTQGWELNLQACSPCSSRLPQLCPAEERARGNSPTAPWTWGGSRSSPPAPAAAARARRRLWHRAEPQDTGLLQLEPGVCSAWQRQEPRKEGALDIRNITNLIFYLRAVYSVWCWQPEFKRW